VTAIVSVNTVENIIDRELVTNYNRLNASLIE
jgi:hypothetical protein